LSVLLKHESDLQAAKRQLFTPSSRDRRQDNLGNVSRWQN
jgi:hypothetical protein